ncbi:MAG TPA: leucine-rich repeat domain-containing protein [Chryseosolibacter sp.]
MKQTRSWSLLFLFLVFFHFAEAQKSKAKTQKPAKKPAATQKAPEKKPSTTESKSTAKPTAAVDNSKDSEKIKDIVSFLQFVLNTLGSPSTSSRDKDVLITQSYSKIFRDEKVQVEDDLDENRETITNKDIVAYLKDVDFFFEQVKFEFAIEDIQSSTLPNGNLFYKVTTRRTLDGISSEGVAVKNVQPRFIEINFNPDDQDLKIVSMYTKEFNEKAALTNWWNELSYEWRSIFKKKANLQADSLSLAEIKKITSIETLDLTGNKYIQNIEPLGQLVGLKNLSLAETNITDLTPIRNLTGLVRLDLSDTKVEDLTALKYSSNLSKLDLSNTGVADIAVIEKMTLLDTLDISHTKVFDFTQLNFLSNLVSLDASNTQLAYLSPIEKLTTLRSVDVSNTLVQDLTPLKNMTSLEILSLDSTRISSLNALSALQNLKVIEANYTRINTLEPLKNLKSLEKVYCDQTEITREKADAFRLQNAAALVIYDSKDLKSWWDGLNSAWQNVFKASAKIGTTPSKEDLAAVTNLDSINVTRNPGIVDLEPLRKLLKLKLVRVGGTAVKDLSPLEDHRDIMLLDISDTPLSDIFLVRQFSKLREFRADNTKVESLDALFGLKDLRKVYVDHTSIHDITAAEFLEKNPQALLVYKTHHLRRWWSGLSPGWKEALQRKMGTDTTSTRENFHKLIELETIELQEANIDNLNPLNEFVRLKKLNVSGTGVNVFPALENLKTLTSLRVANSPLQGIDYIGQLTSLTELDISNTPVDELKPLGNLDNLKLFNCAGTQIKRLDPLERLDALETLDCSNTKVGSLDPVEPLPLKTLKVYNTKVSARAIEKFKERKPDCNVVYYR